VDVPTPRSLLFGFLGSSEVRWLIRQISRPLNYDYTATTTILQPLYRITGKDFVGAKFYCLHALAVESPGKSV